MAILSSTFAVGHAQADGRRYVTERHTDDAGGVHEREYLAALGADHAAIAAAYAVELADELAAGEFEAILNGA